MRKYVELHLLIYVSGIKPERNQSIFNTLHIILALIKKTDWIARSEYCKCVEQIIVKFTSTKLSFMVVYLLSNF